MTTLNDFLFPVEMVHNPEITNSEYSRKVIAQINGTEQVLNYCSPRYNLLKNEYVFPVIEAYLENANCVFKKAYKMNSDMTTFHAMYIIYSVDGVDVGITIGDQLQDKIYPTVTADNSYNGMQQGLMGLGYFRLICSNGLVIPYEGSEVKNFMVKGKHTKKLSLTFEELIGKIETFISMQDTFKKRLTVLTDRKIEKYADRVEAVLNATNIKLRKSQLADINMRIKMEADKFYGGKVNDWLIYNGINFHIFKGKDSKGNVSKALPEVKRKLDRKVFDFISKPIEKVEVLVSDN